MTVLVRTYYSRTALLGSGEITKKRTKLRSLPAFLATLGILALSPPLFAQESTFEKSFNEGTQAMRTADWSLAAASFTRAAKLLPTSSEAHFNLGLALLQQAHLRAAVSEFDRAVALSPRLKGPHLFLGIAQYRLNNYPAAVAALGKETQIDGHNAKAWMWLGVTQLAAGEADGASASLDKAALLSPNDVDVLYHRGRAHMLVSQESYERMYKADPNSWRVHEALAQSFVEADRLDDAIQECQNALNLRPSEPGLHEELADIYWKQNQLEKAEAAFQEELKIDPESLSSRYKLAVVSLERSKPDVTVALLSQILLESPEYRDAHYQKGRAEAQLGHLDDAIADFNAEVARGQAADPESVRQSYYQLAQLYRRAQKPEESKAALDAFLRLKQQEDASQAQKLQDKLKRSAEINR